MDSQAEMYTGTEISFGRVVIRDNAVIMGGNASAMWGTWSPRAVFHLGHSKHVEIDGNMVEFPAASDRLFDFCVYSSTSVNVTSSNSCGGRPCRLSPTTCQDQM